MPLYNYMCHVCDTTEEEFVHNRDEEIFCETCGEKKHRQFPKKTGPINFSWPEDGVVLEHAGPTPVHLKTRSVHGQRF